MRILHVTAQRPDSTGSGVFLHETVMALREMGHEQAVVAGVGPKDASPFPDNVLFEPVRFETVDLPFPVAGMSDVMPYRATRYRDLTPEMVAPFKAAFNAAFDRVFAELEPDVILCHHLYLACAVLMDWLAWRPDVRARCSVRGISHNTDVRQFQSHELERDFIREGICDLDFACALHDALAAEIVETYGIDRARVKVTGTGYNNRVFSMAAGSGQSAVGESGSASQGYQLVYVGKLWKQKGLIQLIGALDALPPDVAARMRIDFVGGYSDEAERDEIAARASSCQVAVSFLGKVDQDQLVDAYRRADVFVLPSFSEGLPLVVVEALACGCKVVITDLPGVRDWFARYAPDAPIWYVALPRMVDGDPAAGPVPDDVPQFEAALANAIAEACAAPARPCNLSALTWSALAKRLIS